MTRTELEHQITEFIGKVGIIHIILHEIERGKNAALVSHAFKSAITCIYHLAIDINGFIVTDI